MVIDMEDEQEPIEIEKWVANEGQVYVEFDKSIRKLPQLRNLKTNDEILRILVMNMNDHDVRNRVAGYRRVIFADHLSSRYGVVLKNGHQYNFTNKQQQHFQSSKDYCESSPHFSRLH